MTAASAPTAGRSDPRTALADRARGSRLGTLVPGSGPVAHEGLTGIESHGSPPDVRTVKE